MEDKISEESIAPSFQYVNIDETRFYKKAFLVRIGEGAKIYGSYIFDLNERTFCCEITPSYYLEYAGSFIVGGEYSEAIDEEVMQANVHSEGHYRHCRSVTNYKPIAGETLDEALDQYHSNCGSYQTV